MTLNGVLAVILRYSLNASHVIDNYVKLIAAIDPYYVQLVERIYFSAVYLWQSQRLYRERVH